MRHRSMAALSPPILVAPMKAPHCSTKLLLRKPTATSWRNACHEFLCGGKGAECAITPPLCSVHPLARDTFVQILLAPARGPAREHERGLDSRAPSSSPP